MKSLPREVYRLCRTTVEDVFENKSRARKAIYAKSMLAYCLYKLSFDPATISRMLQLSQTSTFTAVKRIESFKEIRDRQTIDILAKLSNLFEHDF